MSTLYSNVRYMRNYSLIRLEYRISNGNGKKHYEVWNVYCVVYDSEMSGKLWYQVLKHALYCFI